MCLHLILFLLRWPSWVSHLRFITFYLMVQSNHTSTYQSQSIDIHGLSHIGLCIGKVLLDLNSFRFRPKTHDIALDLLTLRLEEMKISWSLLRSFCKLIPNLRKTTTPFA
jgi:hypothetical protein